jgi:hypothetical protein
MSSEYELFVLVNSLDFIFTKLTFGLDPDIEFRAA